MYCLKKEFLVAIGTQKCKKILNTEVNEDNKIDSLMNWPSSLIKYRIHFWGTIDENERKVCFSIIPKYCFNQIRVVGEIKEVENGSVVKMRKFPMIIPYIITLIVVLLVFFCASTIKDIVGGLVLFLVFTSIFLLNLRLSNFIFNVIETTLKSNVL